MFSFFNPPETHPEAKTMGQYYDDLADTVEQVRDQVKDANLDPAFKKAAGVISELVSLCRDMEIVSATEANDINSQRRTLMKTIGTDGLMDVKGEASKLLAGKYIGLLHGLLNKDYWPSEDCPAVPLLGMSFLTEYGKAFESRRPHMENSIQKLESRIAAYEHAAQLKPAM